jgi:hypothetical protein
VTARLVAPPRAAPAFSPIIPNERGILRPRKVSSPGLVGLGSWPGELLEGRLLMHAGSFNVNAGMVGGYLSADLRKLSGDVHSGTDD